MKARSPITTHVLDLVKGKPAAGLAVTLSRKDKQGWKELARGQTNADGRVEDLLEAGSKVDAGVYRLVFETQSFYPSITIEFQLSDPSQHHHIPLLLSPYGYSTYRGS